MSSSYLSRSVTPSTATSWTVSFWFKLTNINPSSGTPYLWSCGSTSGGGHGIYYNNSTDVLRYYGHTGYADAALSEGALRDTHGWYHCVLSVNSGTGTSYINGVQQGSTISNIGPLNAHTGNLMAVNAYVGGLSTYDDSGVYMSHFHFIDGTAYAASTFGSTDSTTGEWKLNTSPSVTYGTNGFFLFKDNASVNDQSGNGNNFTASGTVSQTEDCPSNVFCTINALNTQISGLTIGNGNTSRSSSTGDAWRTTYGTLAASSGKFYWEQKVTGSVGSALYIGITDQDENRHANTNDFENANVSAYCYRGDGGKVTSVSGSTVLTASAGASFTNGDIIGIAMDLDNQKIYFSKNGTWQASGDPTSGSTGTGSFFNITAGKLYTPATACYNTAAGYQYNFGNGSFGGTAISSEGTNASGIGKFEYDVPTGYTALSTKGLNE